MYKARNWPKRRSHEKLGLGLQRAKLCENINLYYTYQFFLIIAGYKSRSQKKCFLTCITVGEGESKKGDIRMHIYTYTCRHPSTVPSPQFKKK